MEAAEITSWTFVEETPIPKDAQELMVQGEHPYVAFKTFRDSAIFTNKRLIVRDAQGLTGKRWRCTHSRTAPSTCGPQKTQALWISTLKSSCGLVRAKSKLKLAAASMPVQLTG